MASDEMKKHRRISDKDKKYILPGDTLSLNGVNVQVISTSDKDCIVMSEGKRKTVPWDKLRVRVN